MQKAAWILDALRERPGAFVASWARAARDESLVLDDTDLADLELVRSLLLEALSADDEDAEDAWAEFRLELERLTRSRSRRGLSPVSTAALVRTLKAPLRTRVSETTEEPLERSERLVVVGDTVDELVHMVVQTTIDELDDVLEQQRSEMVELSTPVIEVWQGIIAMPLVGTLDSRRTELVMETLLEGIAATHARIAILDITGVATMDSMTAQRLLKTVAAARLMGSECIISGLGPHIAQTMVQLGVDVGSVVTTSKLSSALHKAYQLCGYKVVKINE